MIPRSAWAIRRVDTHPDAGKVLQHGAELEPVGPVDETRRTRLGRP